MYILFLTLCVSTKWTHIEDLYFIAPSPYYVRILTCTLVQRITQSFLPLLLYSSPMLRGPWTHQWKVLLSSRQLPRGGLSKNLWRMCSMKSLCIQITNVRYPMRGGKYIFTGLVYNCKHCHGFTYWRCYWSYYETAIYSTPAPILCQHFALLASWTMGWSCCTVAITVTTVTMVTQ